MLASTRISIKQLVALGTAAIIALLLASAALSIWVFSNAEAQLSRSLYSYEQLAIATRLETDASKALLAAVLRRDGTDTSAGLDADEEVIRSALDALISRIRDEISSISNSDEQAEEAQEFAAVFAIRASYARLKRALEAVAPAGDLEAPAAIDPVALEHFFALNEQLARVIAGEREELNAALSSLGAARERLQRFAILTAIFAALCVAVAGVWSYRRLVAPLASLDRGSAELAAGRVEHRLPISGPREFAELAQRLNDMAARLAAQRDALSQSNEQLEKVVAQRTFELAEKAHRLQEIDDSRRLFFAKVGHELRTPLTVLLGETELALQSRNASPGDTKQALEHIAANGEHLKRRIDDLMAVARSEDGKLTLQRETVELTALARDTVRGTVAFARSNDVALLLHCPDTRLTALADPGWLRQALMALIDNAIKFSPQAGCVELHLAAEGHSACFSVRDRGPGVPAADLPMLTDPYFQSSGAQARVGVGLGLAVAHWVAEQHAGTLRARNQEDEGFAVDLLIPLSLAA